MEAKYSIQLGHQHTGLAWIICFLLMQKQSLVVPSADGEAQANPKLPSEAAGAPRALSCCLGEQHFLWGVLNVTFGVPVTPN